MFCVNAIDVLLKNHAKSDYSLEITSVVRTRFTLKRRNSTYLGKKEVRALIGGSSRAVEQNMSLLFRTHNLNMLHRVLYYLEQ